MSVSSAGLNDPNANKARSPTTLPLEDGEDIEYITTPELIEEKFGGEADLIIDGGIGGTEPSTVVNCTEGEAEIVRQGKGWLEE